MVSKVIKPKPTDDNSNEVDLKFGVNLTSLKGSLLYSDDKSLPIQNVGFYGAYNEVEANV